MLNLLHPVKIILLDLERRAFLQASAHQMNVLLTFTLLLKFFYAGGNLQLHLYLRIEVCKRHNQMQVV